MTITSRTTATPEAYLSLLSASKFDVFGNPALMSSHLERDLLDINKAVLAGFTAAVFSVAAPCQTLSLRPVLPSAETSFAGTHLPNFQVQALRMDPLTEDGGDSGAAPKSTEHNGLIERIVKRGLQDQKGLYAAPFKISNLKWDAVVLAGTGAFLATDTRIGTCPAETISSIKTAPMSLWEDWRHPWLDCGLMESRRKICMRKRPENWNWKH